jgi:hypothetical protein
VESVNVRAEAICQTPFSAPLTHAEIDAFESLISALPDGRVPEFATAFDFADDESGFSPEELVLRHRKRFRDTLDPLRQSQLWQRDAEISKALGRHKVDPDAFAMLVIRVSSAWAASALADRQGEAHCRSLKVLADDRIAEICGSIHRIDAHPELHAPEMRTHLRSALVETVALSEFLGLLERVPAGSLTAIAGRRQQLAPLMPAVETVTEFERRLESNPTVIPVGYETP